MVKLIQIHWKDEQIEKLYPFAIPYKNLSLSPFFENSVIADLVPKIGVEIEKIAICSWNLANKMRTNYPPTRQLTEEILNSEYDVLSLTKNSPGFGMLYTSEMWHPGFLEILDSILAMIGIRRPNEVKYPIFQNAFCAKREIYQAYVKEMLIPAMEVMDNDQRIRSLCWRDSGYYKLRSVPEFAERVKQFLGVNFCPMHTFLCERFFSIWIENKNLNIQYI